ncbi:conserved hypothetical protein [Candidatus Brocadia pituitae]|nr:conserved hypothetical protein [Candidatus Brocadia pituitae]
MYVTADPNMGKKTYDIEYADENGIPTVRVYYKRNDSKIPGVNFMRNIKGGYLGLKMIKEKFGMPDINHVNVAFPAGLLALLLKKLRKIPYVITEHFTAYTEYAAELHKQPFRANFFTKLIFKNATTVSAVSQYLLDGLKKHNLTSKNGFVIPNAIDIPQRLHSSRNSNGVIKILTISLLSDRQKNISGLINAVGNITKNKNIELHIVGNGEDRERLEEHTKKLGLLKRSVFFYGYVPNNELYKYFSYANFFVLNSNYETFSVVSAEALAHGVPVVTTKCGGPEGFINKEVGVLVERQNEESLTRGIEYVIDNSGTYDSKKLQEYAKKNFSYEAVGKKITSIYKDTLSDHYKKYPADNSGYKIKIRGDWKVLDVGSGHNPHPRANVLLDKNIYDNTDRSGKSIKIDNSRLFVEGNAESMPFYDKEFDLLIASHIAEHSDNPEKFCRELMRVSKGGYIETPSKFAEILFDEPYHSWYVYVKNDILIFERINIRSRLGLIGKLFYAVYYINTERNGKRTIIFNNKCLCYVTSNVVHYLLKKPLLLSGILYTRFEWKESFRFKILEEKNSDRT